MCIRDRIYKAQWAPLTFGYLVATLIGAIPGQVGPTLVLLELIEAKSALYYGIHVPLSVVGWIVAEFFMAGLVRATLRAVHTGDASFGDFFSAGQQFLSFLAMSFLRSLAIVVGLVLLVVPGVILLLGFANAPYFSIDQRLGPIASLRESWASAEGQKSDLFLFVLAEIGLTIVGLLACCVGLLVVVPFMQVARAIVYTRMSGTAAPLAPSAGPPPGGYGVYGPPGTFGGPSGPPGYGPPGR